MCNDYILVCLRDLGSEHLGLRIFGQIHNGFISVVVAHPGLVTIRAAALELDGGVLVVHPHLTGQVGVDLRLDDVGVVHHGLGDVDFGLCAANVLVGVAHLADLELAVQIAGKDGRGFGVLVHRQRGGASRPGELVGGAVLGRQHAHGGVFVQVQLAVDQADLAVRVHADLHRAVGVVRRRRVGVGGDGILGIRGAVGLEGHAVLHVGGHQIIARVDGGADDLHLVAAVLGRRQRVRQLGVGLFAVIGGKHDLRLGVFGGYQQVLRALQIVVGLAGIVSTIAAELDA